MSTWFIYLVTFIPWNLISHQRQFHWLLSIFSMQSSSHMEYIKLSVCFVLVDDSGFRNIWWKFGDYVLGGIRHDVYLNMVVDAVICRWVTLVTGEKAGPDRFRQMVQCLSSFFYSDEGLLASLRTARIHAVRNVLMGIFDRVVIHANVNKTVSMVCQPW